MAEVERVGNQVDFGGDGFPSVLGLSNGAFLVSWDSEDSSRGRVAQLYSADGKKIGSDISLQSDATRFDLAGGGHVSIRSIGNVITGQVFAKDGTKVEDGLRVGSLGGRESSLALLQSGSLIGATESYRKDFDIAARRFDADGDAVGSSTVVNSVTAGNQTMPSVAALKSGGYVVTWSDGGTRNIKAQAYAATGAKAGGEFTVNASLEGLQYGSAVTGLDDGGYMMVWSDNAQPTLSMQRFSAGGQKVGGEIDIEGSNRGRYPVVVTLADGTIVVGWQAGNLADYGGVHAQIFTQEGEALAPIFDINTSDRRTQVALSLSPTADGGFVAAWTNASYEDNGQAGNEDGGTYDGSFQLFKPRPSTLETMGGTVTRTVEELARYDRIVTFDEPGRLDEQVSLRLASAGTIDLKDQLEGLRGAKVFIFGGSGNTVYTGKGADTLISAGGDTDLHGGRGGDTYLIRSIGTRVFEEARGGRDAVYAQLPTYVLERGSEVEFLKADGSRGVPNFTLEGNEMNQKVEGGGGSDVLKGWGGNDTLDGKRGADTLSGGSGKDSFVFFTSILFPRGEFDRITDFTHSDDTIVLGASIFKGLRDGTLEDFRFKEISGATSTKGVDQSDRLLYDKARGDLYFDQDGSGSRYDRIKFAEVADNKYLEHNDFLIV